ncbi:MAG TPA: transposase [Candidatus Paceibacterota bacterium]|nr:transposase [Candidatus Paceibacterota bacterium]
MQPAPGYDRLEERRWLFVPRWGILGRFFYAPRRIECPEHGVGVERIPWSQGKRPVTTAMMGFFGPLGAAVVLAGNRPDLPDQLGGRISFGGLDRFHITQHLNQAVDQVRRAESTRLRGKPLAAKLKKMRLYSRICGPEWYISGAGRRVRYAWRPAATRAWRLEARRRRSSACP